MRSLRIIRFQAHKFEIVFTCDDVKTRALFDELINDMVNAIELYDEDLNIEIREGAK